MVLGETDVSFYKWVLVDFEGWCLHSVGAETNWTSVLPSSWCWNNQEVGTSIQLVLNKQGVGASF